MSGKTQTSTSGVSIPPAVLAQYQSVTSSANQTATTPFSQYSGTGTPVAAGYTAANAGNFVAPTNAEQAAGTSSINAASTPITGSQINQYLSPYLSDVLGSTEAVQNQENQQQQAGQLGNAITSGAFGSDRTGIAAANLEEQQNLANNSTIAGIANQGFNTALGEANTEQAAQLAGGEQQIGAGTVQQQTQQAQDTAEYNQFLQQQSYPFQVGSWLAGISEGTGSLEGSTTTTTQPGGFFSDRRLKRDIKKIGKTFDGQDVVTYKMGDDNRTRIGLIAQDVEKKHPEAVGVAGGYKTVDYGKATQKAANEGHFYTGGVVAFPRKKYATGGGLDDALEAQRAMYGQMGGTPGMSGTPRVPAASLSGAHLAVASGGVKPAQTGAQNVMQAAQLAETGDKLYKDFTAPTPTPAPANSTPAAAAPTANVDTANGVMGTGISPTGPVPTDTGAQTFPDPDAMKRGGVAGRHRFDSGGSPYGDDGLNIPDQDSTNKLAVAAPAPSQNQQSGMGDVAELAGIASMFMERGGVVPFRRKRDTGGGLNIPDSQATDTLATAAPLAVGPAQEEQNADMQDVADIAKIAGAVALMAKKGGRIKGYADGGDPTDDDSIPDPTAAPDAAAPAPDATAPAATPSLWDKIKGVAESPGVLAALEGIGAMGTARTVHPGVALAAGLEAAAGAYPGIKQGLAGAQQTEAQTQGIGIQNQILAMRAKAASSYLNPQGTGVVPRAAAPPVAAPTAPQPSTGAVTPGAPMPIATGVPNSGAAPTVQSPANPAAQTAAQIAQGYRNKYFVNPARTPTEQAQYDIAARAEATGVLSGDSAVQQANTDWQTRVTGQQAQNRNAAQQEADTLYSQATDPTADYAARAAAGVRFNAVHQWTGDTYTTANGNKTIDRTGAPAIGAAAQQLTPEQMTGLIQDAQRLIPVPNSDGTTTLTPNWQAHHAPSPQAYAQLNASFATSGLALPGANAPLVTLGTHAPGPSRARVTPNAPQSPPRTVTPAAAAVAPGQQTDPYLSRALSDTSWRAPSFPVISGTSQSPQALNYKNQIIDSGVQLSKDADSVTNTSAMSLQYLKAAQSIMASKGATVGAYGNVVAQAERLVPGAPKVDASNYQQLAKYLSNAAAQTAKASFPAATQQEMGMQFEEMSPNVKMTDATISDLLSTNIRAARYTIDSANRAKAYVGNDQYPLNNPINFEKWNQQYYPREKIVNADQVATNKATGQRLYHIGGQWVP